MTSTALTLLTLNQSPVKAHLLSTRQYQPGTMELCQLVTPNASHHRTIDSSRPMPFQSARSKLPTRADCTPHDVGILLSRHCRRPRSRPRPRLRRRRRDSTNINTSTSTSTTTLVSVYRCSCCPRDGRTCRHHHHHQPGRWCCLVHAHSTSA